MPIDSSLVTTLTGTKKASIKTMLDGYLIKTPNHYEYFNNVLQPLIDNDVTLNDFITTHSGDTDKHITPAERDKWNAAQLFAMTNSNGASKATVSANLNLTIAAGFYNVLAGDLNGQGTAGHMIVMNRGSSANALQILYTLDGKMFTRNTSNGGVTWSNWIELETTAGAQTKVDTHAGDAVKHLTKAERDKWDASQLKKLTESNGFSLTATNADMNTLKETGLFYGSQMTNGPTGTVTGWVMVHAVNNNYTTQDFVINTNTAAGNRRFWRVNYNGTWNGWNEVETTTGAQAKADAAKNAAIAAFNALGLGASGTNIADPNAALESGFYSVANATPNLPAGESYGKLLVFTRNSTNVNQHVIQIYIGYTSRKMFIRSSIDNSANWSSWVDFATSALASASAPGLMSPGDFTKLANLQTTVDAAQKYKLTQDTGNGKVVPGTDLNTVLQPGVYSIPQSSGYSNRPFGSNDLAVLEVYGQDTTGNTIQRFTNLENDWAGKTYTRVCRGGTWTAWKQELQTGDAQMFKLTMDDGTTNSITGYDLNGLTWSGFFYGNNLINNPTGSTIYHRVWVMMSEPTSGMQIATTNGGRMYTRHMTGGTWGQWYQVFNFQNIVTGKVDITPTAANTPMGVTINFPITFKNTPLVFVTASSIVPGTSISGVSSSDETTTSAKVWLTANSTAKRTVNWVAIDTGN